MKSNLRFLEETAAKDKWDPPSLFTAVRSDIVAMTTELMTLFGSAGKAA